MKLPRKQLKQNCMEETSFEKGGRDRETSLYRKQNPIRTHSWHGKCLPKKLEK